VNSRFVLQLKDLFLIRNTIPIIPPTTITDKITINTISKVLKLGVDVGGEVGLGVGGEVGMGVGGLVGGLVGVGVGLFIVFKYLQLDVIRTGLDGFVQLYMSVIFSL